MRRYWAWIAPAYYVAMFAVLWKLCPIYEDGGGPTATFLCANCPTPTGAEFRDHYWELIWPFAIPYFTAAFYLTVLGCGVVPRLTKAPWRACWASCALTLLLALLVQLGARAGLWTVGRQIFVWDDWILYMMAKTTLYIGLITAIFTYLQIWLRSKGVGASGA